MTALTVFDWLALAVLAMSLLWGVWRGLVHEVLGLLGWVLAFWVAQRYSPALAHHLTMWSSESLRLAAAFFLLFLATVVLVAVMIWMLGRLMSAVGLRPVDRMLGGLFGLLRAALLLLAVGVLVNAAGWRDSAWWSGSLAGDGITQALQVLKLWMPAPWADYL